MSNINRCLLTLEDSYQYSAEGDRCVMFAALYNKYKDPTLIQERHKRPDRTRVIHKLMEMEFSIKGLPKWGATAVRGDLMDNKEHIRKFIDAVNALNYYEVCDAWTACCKAYKLRMDALYVPIELNSKDTLLNVIDILVYKKSGGRVQQPLCAAVTEKMYSLIGREYRVQTKKVFAGDAQSKAKGDVQIFKNDKLICVIEIKAHQVDNAKLIEVLKDHGRHNYALIVAGESFHKNVEKQENLGLCTIHDYVISTLSHIAAIKGNGLESAAREVIEHYNQIMTCIEERPDLSVSLP